jgi:N4-gp56 family major capsid protein
MPININGDISPRTAGYVVGQLLDRAIPDMCIEKFGQGKPIPKNNTRTAIFRRYEALDNTPNYLAEGVTPPGKSLRKTDIAVTLQQMGDRVTITDVIQDTHEDPVLNETADLLAEQAAQMIERMRWMGLRAGTNVLFSNGAARSAVNTVLSTAIIRRAVRILERQNCRKVTRVLRPTADYNTEAVAAAYAAICHPDLEGDIRNCSGFVPVEKYTVDTPWPNEIGKVEKVRFLAGTLYDAFLDAGGTPTGVLSNAGSAADVYPIIIVGMDAYGIVPLRGEESIVPMIVNPGRPSDSDPLGQRGHAAWKTMQNIVILNDLWMLRLEVACAA